MKEVVVEYSPPVDDVLFSFQKGLTLYMIRDNPSSGFESVMLITSKFVSNVFFILSLKDLRNSVTVIFLIPSPSTTKLSFTSPISTMLIGVLTFLANGFEYGST